MTLIPPPPPPPAPSAAPSPADFNKAADFWRYVIGVNVIPAKSKGKVTFITWKQSGYQDNSITEEQHNEWKRTNAFAEGMAVVTGEVRMGQHAGEYFNCIDCDNRLAINEFCTRDGQTISLEKIAEKFIVEQHKDNPNKAHIYFYSKIPIVAKASSTNTVGKDKIENNQVPGFEIKSQSNTIVFCTPSFHQNGRQYEFIGNCTIPTTLNERQSTELMQHLDNIHKKYGMQYLEVANGNGKSLIPMSELEKEDFVILEGNNRHEGLLRYMDSRIKIFGGKVPEQEIKELCHIWNKQHCKPPLDEKEFEKQWKSATNFIERKERERQEQEDKQEEEEKQNQQEQQQTDSGDDGEEEEERSSLKKVTELPQPDIPLAWKNDYFEYLIVQGQKTVKEESALIRQIDLTILSSYSDDPNNLGVLAPTSTGKSYPIMQCIKFTPGGKEVRIIASMTPKVLVREQGILVDKDKKPIGRQVRKLKSAIKTANSKKQYGEVSALQEELEKLLEDSAYILELSDKTLIFLEPPHPELWNLLKPILSHDSYEMEHPFVDNIGRGLEVKRVITRGWPACIFCSARDESKWDIWPEVESRFMIQSPNMIKAKWEQGNELIALKKWQPRGVKQQLIISDKDLQLGKDCFLFLKHQIRQYRQKTDSPIWAPFGEIIGKVFPSDKGQDNRAFNRFATILNILTLCKAHLRYKVLYDDEELVIPSLLDLQETLHVMQNMTGLPPHKLKFYNDYIVPLCKAYREAALTSKQIADYYNAVNKESRHPMNSDNLRKNYLQELVNHNYLEQEQDTTTKAAKYLFTPLILGAEVEEGERQQKQEQQEQNKSPTAPTLEQVFNNLHYSKLILPETIKEIPKDWLKQEILQLSKRRLTDAELKILTPEGKEASIDDFVTEYEKELKLEVFFATPRLVGDSNSVKIAGSEGDS